MKVVSGLCLSEAAVGGCQSEPEKAVAAMLIGWQVIVKNCLTINEKWKLDNPPPDSSLVVVLEEIYSTNWPNRRIYQALRNFYSADPQAWWEQKDLRARLDLALASALETVYSCRARGPKT